MNLVESEFDNGHVFQRHKFVFIALKIKFVFYVSHYRFGSCSLSRRKGTQTRKGRCILFALKGS